MSTELNWLSATDLVAKFRAGEVSPVEVAKAVLDRIDEVDAKTNAFCLVDGDAALEQARASEARWAAGAPAGRVDGVPALVKDILVTKGWPTLRGCLSRECRGFQPGAPRPQAQGRFHHCRHWLRSL